MSNNNEFEEILISKDDDNNDGDDPSLTLSQGGGGNEFISQMEQVFRAIDRDSTGVITLAQLREEIESLGADVIESNPLIGQLLEYLKTVHHQASHDGDEVDMDMINDNDISIDFDNFVESMTRFMEGVDAKESRRLLLEKNRLPKFKVPVDMLKKYNITPKGSPLIQGVQAGSQYSHTANFSPSKNNKFNKLFSAKPVITFDQFEELTTKLNGGKSIPKNKLLMFINDLPVDNDGFIDITSFISRYSGLNHPMSPKLTFEDSDLKQTEQQQQQREKTSLEWSKNSAIMSQLQENYKTLEKECDTFQSEITFLEKTRQQLEGQLKKKEQEIDRLKKDAKFVDGMRDSNKDLTVQNTNLKTTISKLTQNDAALRDGMEAEKEKSRSLSEQIMMKDLEIKKLNHLLKTQQNINNKLSMMVTFSNETSVENQKNASFTEKRIKPTIDKAKQILSKQKSEFFEPPKSGTTSPPIPIVMQSPSTTTPPYDGNLSSSSPQSASASPVPPSAMTDSLQKEFEQLQQQDEVDQLKEQLKMMDGEIELPDLDEVVKESPQLTTANNDISSANTTTSMQSPIEPPTNINTSNNQVNTTTTSSTTTTATNTPSKPTPPALIKQHSMPKISTQQPQPQQSPLRMSQQQQSSNSIQSPLRISQQQTPVTSPIASNPYHTISPRSPPMRTSPNYDQMFTSPQQQFQYNSLGYSNPFNQQQQQQPLSPFDLSNTFSPLTNYNANNPNGGSIKRMKKSDLIRLHTNELEAQKESTQSLLNEQQQALTDLAKNKDQEIQRIQKMYQEEKQANKFLEKQLSTQLEKNKELVAGKEKNSWGGMQGFFSFVSYFLPSSLFCNVSSTS